MLKNTIHDLEGETIRKSIEDQPANHNMLVVERAYNLPDLEVVF